MEQTLAVRLINQVRLMLKLEETEWKKEMSFRIIEETDEIQKGIIFLFFLISLEKNLMK